MRRRWNFRQASLTIQLTVTMTVLVILVVAGVSLLFIQRAQESFQTELYQQAKLVLDTLKNAGDNALYSLNADYLDNVIDDLPDNELILSARYYDRNGRTIADSSASRAIFSSSANTLGSRLLASETPIYEWQEGQLVAGRGVVIGRETIGAISVIISTRQLEAKVATARTEGILFAIGAALVGALLALYLSRTIVRPLQALTDATRRVADGDLSHELQVQGSSELTTLASSFNAMAAQLRVTIANLKQQAIELQALNEKVSEASRLKSEFLSTMSHELRTPLNAIIGFSGILLEGMAGQIDNTARYMIEATYTSSQHLLSLINNVLDISKIEAGRLEIVNAPLHTRDMIDQWKTQTDILAKQKGLLFEVNLDSALPPVVNGDRERISQVAINLLSNAFKFTDRGRVTLDVGWQESVFTLRVADTGIGIPPHALDYIFDEFRQVDGSAQRSQNGTGLGLAIVRKLCSAMGGNVFVNSKLGEGSIFTVTLPMQAVSNVPQSAKEEAVEGQVS